MTSKAFLLTFLMLCTLGSLWHMADASAKESTEIKVFDPNFKMSDQEMLDLLKKVDLERRGYKKEETTKLVSKPESEKPLYEKSFLFYKEINCSRLREIDQELESLLPGLFGSALVTKINQEINTKNLTKVKHCKVGLEVHFKEAEGCIDPKSRRRRKRANRCGWCLICWATKLYN